MTTEKVVSLYNQKLKNNKNTKRFDTEVYDQIMRFLREHARSSKNTSAAYERDIRHFFITKRNTEIEHLTREHLIFTTEEFEDYQAYLLDELGASVNTSNRHITSISECMKHLHRRDLIDDIKFLDIKRPKALPNSYDGLTSEEIRKVAEFVLTQGRKTTAKNKRALILFSYDTCMRLKECLDLKWANFGEIGSDNMIPVRTVAKGNKVMNRKISLDLYNELLELKKEGSDKVFHISESTVERMMDQIRKYLDIDPNKRTIVFHSIRKAGAQWIWEKTRDINQVSKALGHASIQTTELYINKNENYGIVGAISSAQGVDEKLYKKVSYEELIKAIDSLGIDKQMFINLKLQEMVIDG